MALSAFPGVQSFAVSAEVTELASIAVSAPLQAEEYEGVVIDANTQESIIGATVRLKNNPAVGVVTDVDGRSASRPGLETCWRYPMWVISRRK